jgi:hypothetical protein
MFVTPARPGELEAITLSEDSVRLSSAKLGQIHLTLGHNFRVIEDSTAGYRVTTAGYVYGILDPDGQELLGWHWHPDSRVQRPHLHIHSEPLTHKIHIPTGRVTIESVLRMLAEELAVIPKRADWADVLQASELPHLEHRTWSG